MWQEFNQGVQLLCCRRETLWQEWKQGGVQHLQELLLPVSPDDFCFTVSDGGAAESCSRSCGNKVGNSCRRCCFQYFQISNFTVSDSIWLFLILLHCFIVSELKVMETRWAGSTCRRCCFQYLQISNFTVSDSVWLFLILCCCF